MTGGRSRTVRTRVALAAPAVLAAVVVGGLAAVPSATAAPLVQHSSVRSAMLVTPARASAGGTANHGVAAPALAAHPDAVVNVGLSRKQAKHLQTHVLRYYGYQGHIDGLLGTASWKAMQRFLRDKSGYHGHIDGIPGPKTYEALQRSLRNWGWYRGRIDGIPGPNTKTGFKKMAMHLQCDYGHTCWHQY